VELQLRSFKAPTVWTGTVQRLFIINCSFVRSAEKYWELYEARQVTMWPK